MFIAKEFDICKSLSKKFGIYSKIVDRGVGNFVRHPDSVALSTLFIVLTTPAGMSLPSSCSLIRRHKKQGPFPIFSRRFFSTPGFMGL